MRLYDNYFKRHTLDSECKEKYMDQFDAMQKCFDRVIEEQRLNPPIKPESYIHWGNDKF